MNSGRKFNLLKFTKKTSIINILFSVILFPFICFTSYAQSPGQIGMFRAAVVKVDITPRNSQYLLGYNERKSAGVHDPVFHRIVALDDGVTQFFLVSTEICVISPVEYDRITAQIKSRLGIDPVNLWWTVTHTHSAPEVGPSGLDRVFMSERFQHEVDSGYTTFVEQKLIEGITESRQKLSSARLGVSWGFSQANINRRARDIDGKTSLGMNPDGPVDRRIGLLRIENEDGTPICLIANYPMHGTVLGSKNLLISGDAPGVVSEFVEQNIGAPLIFINGAAGNLAPIYSGSNFDKFGQFPVLLGNKILDANQKILATTNSVILHSGEIVVETPRKEGLEWPSDLNDYNRTTRTGINMVRIPIRFLKINEDIAIWGTPLELFCEIANEIRNRSPYPFTFYFGYTNGWLGYVLTEDEYKYGGYESSVSPYTFNAARDITDAVVNHLQGKMRVLKP